MIVHRPKALALVWNHKAALEVELAAISDCEASSIMFGLLTALYLYLTAESQLQSFHTSFGKHKGHLTRVGRAFDVDSFPAASRATVLHMHEKACDSASHATRKNTVRHTASPHVRTLTN